MLERVGIGLAVLTIPPFFIILTGDLFDPARGDQLRSARGRVIRWLLASFWTVAFVGAFVAAVWLSLQFEGLARFFALVVPPVTAVYALRFLGPGITRIAMRRSGG